MVTLPQVSVGEILLRVFLLPLNLSKYRLAKDLGDPAQRIGDIVAGKRTVTADTDLRLFLAHELPPSQTTNQLKKIKPR